MKKIYAIKAGSLIVLLSALCAVSIVTAQAEEVTQTYEGLTLNGNLELADGKRIQDGVVLMVHGLMAHNRMEIMASAQRALKENGWNSLAINLSLGIDNRHGFFECEWPHRHLQDDALDEIAAWVAWLRGQGVSRIPLLAHSRGANQAMVYAVNRRDAEVTRLIFLAPGTAADSKDIYEGRFGPGYDEMIAHAEAQIAKGKGDELMADINLLYCPRAMVTANSFLSYYGQDSPFRQFEVYLPQIDVPTLVTTGTMDDRFPKIQEKVSPYVDGRLIRLSVVDNAGHFFRDFNIDEAMEAAVEFLEQTE